MANLVQFVRQTTYASPILSNGGFTLASFNSLASGSCLIAGTALSLTGVVDPFWELSFQFVMGGTTVAGDFIELYALPLNRDAATYGDNSTGGSTLPQIRYRVGATGTLVGVASGSTIYGSIQFELRTTQDTKFCIANRTSVAFNAAAAAQVALSTARYNLNA